MAMLVGREGTPLRTRDFIPPSTSMKLCCQPIQKVPICPFLTHVWGGALDTQKMYVLVGREGDTRKADAPPLTGIPPVSHVLIVAD